MTREERTDAILNCMRDNPTERAELLTILLIPKHWDKQSEKLFDELLDVERIEARYDELHEREKERLGI